MALKARVVERLIIGDGPVNGVSADHLVLPLLVLNVHRAVSASWPDGVPGCVHGGVYRGGVH